MSLNIKTRKLPRGGLVGFNSSLKQIKKEFGIELLESRGEISLNRNQNLSVTLVNEYNFLSQ